MTPDDLAVIHRVIDAQAKLTNQVLVVVDEIRQDRAETRGVRLAVERQARASEDIAAQLETALRALRIDVAGAKGAADGAKGAADGATDAAKKAQEAAADAKDESRVVRLHLAENKSGKWGVAERMLDKITKRPIILLGVIGALIALTLCFLSFWLVERGWRVQGAHATAALHAPRGAEGTP